MASRLSILFDLNVIMDALQRREPFFATSASALACAETKRIHGWVAPHSLTTLFYLIAKYRSPDRARVAISELLTFLSVAPIDQTVIEKALNLPYDDFEDAVQMASAVGAGADYVVTRDATGYRVGPLPALEPAEMLALVRY
jgi:predicted nucleic acid-binding protein